MIDQFKSFLDVYCPSIDIHAAPIDGSAKSMNRLRVPVRGAKNFPFLLKHQDTHEFYVAPTYRRLDDAYRTFVFQAPPNVALRGVKHIRIDVTSSTYFWVASASALNQLESYEAAFWLMTKLGIKISSSYGFCEVNELAWTPLPITTSAELTTTFIDGKTLLVPSHAERAAYLFDHLPSGWDYRIHEESSRKLAGNWRVNGEAAILDPFTEARMSAIKSLAAGEPRADVIRKISEYLASEIPTSSPERSDWRARRIVEGLLAHRPAIFDSYNGENLNHEV